MKMFTRKGKLIVENQLHYCSNTVPNIYWYSCYIYNSGYNIKKKIK